MSTRNIPFVQFLSSNGDGTGTTNFAADYSSSQGVAYIAPGAGEVLHITLLAFHISDSGLFSRTGFGAGVALSEGITISASSSGESSVYVDALQKNDDIPHSFSSFVYTQWGGSEDSVTAYFDATKFGGVRLALQSGDAMSMYLNDNLTGLSEVICTAHGYRTLDA